MSSTTPILDNIGKLEGNAPVCLTPAQAAALRDELKRCGCGDFTRLSADPTYRGPAVALDGSSVTEDFFEVLDTCQVRPGAQPHRRAPRWVVCRPASALSAASDRAAARPADEEIARLLLEAADFAAEGAVDTARSRVLAAAATAAAGVVLLGNTHEGDRYGAILGMAQKLATTFA